MPTPTRPAPELRPAAERPDGAPGLSLVCVGLSHHTAPVAVRERLALDEAGVRDELTRLREAGIASEALLVSTCNRVELYAVAEPAAVPALRASLGRRGVPQAELDRHLFVHAGVEAVRHLFRVACSLDSLVVGEPQILGQVKEAVRQATEAHALGPLTHRLTQRALKVAKEIRTHTDIGRFNVGVGNAGVWLAQQIFSSLQGRRALLIGTGEMGQQVATAMVGAGLSELLVASRTFQRAVEVAEEFHGTAIPFERIGQYLAQVDVVITATGAQQPILGPEEVRAAVKARRNRPLFLVDLAVPRNIAPEVEKVDQAYLFNVDDLTGVVERGQRARQEAAAHAEARVAEEAQRFATRLQTLESHAGIGRLTRWAEALRQEELSRSRRLVDGLTDEQREQVDAMTRALVKKLLHGPIRAIRDAAEAGDGERAQGLVAVFEEEERRG
jgi:glutamyl-tRNA reductase